jgi:hypothetical protein
MTTWKKYASNDVRHYQQSNNNNLAKKIKESSISFFLLKVGKQKKGKNRRMWMWA